MEWEPDKPKSLLDTCVQFCVKNSHVLCEFDDDSETYNLREGISLPNEICELLLSGLIENQGAEKLYMFQDTDRTKVKRLKLRHTLLKISADLICKLLKHNLTELDIIGCKQLKSESIIKEINTYGQQLTSLCVSDHYIFQAIPLKQIDLDDDDSSLNDADYIFQCPRLKALAIHELHETQCCARDIIHIALKPLTNLSQLDLSYCEIEFEKMDFIANLQNLLSLILYEVPIKNINMAFNIIVKLKKLRALDISQGQEQSIQYEDSTDSLAFLMEHLPQLTHLDLSGTNLAGFVDKPPVDHRLGRTHTDSGQGEASSMRVPIPGLENRRLQFLGLLGCLHDPCSRENIPANKVTGETTEEQIILATQMYVDKKELLINALNSLFKIFRFSECMDQRGALEGILNGMKKWPLDKSVQICGSASLFYIVKGEKKHNLNTNLKRRIIKAILVAMDKHMDEPTMNRNGCLTLCHFSIPHDVLFVYEDLVSILLKMVAPAGQEEFVQRIDIYLLNSLACQVDGKEKQIVGDLGAISTMLDIIRYKLSKGVCDEVMEIAWSTMWNVTDETSINCQRFIDEGGMQLFLQGLERFPDKEELLRNMMGLLGNVAEVPFLRCRLMQREYVTVFSNLLDSKSDGIEVSYNACGVLAHMVSDGPEAWTIDEPARPSVLMKIMAAISRWPLRTKRNINYRSFQPILRLLPMFETPECQYWAVWALCNLTKMYRSKYCPLVEKENGLPLLSKIVQDHRPYSPIKKLANEVLERHQRYLEEPDVMTEDEMETECD